MPTVDPSLFLHLHETFDFLNVGLQCCDTGQGCSTQLFYPLQAQRLAFCTLDCSIDNSIVFRVKRPDNCQKGLLHCTILGADVLKHPVAIPSAEAHLEEYESGRTGTLGKCVWGNSPWVRIPPPPREHPYRRFRSLSVRRRGHAVGSH